MAAMLIFLGILCSTSLLQLMPGALAKKQITVKGFVSQQMIWFDSHDSNKDGHLSYDEVKQVSPTTLKQFLGKSKGCYRNFKTAFFNTINVDKSSSSLDAGDFHRSMTSNGGKKVSKKIFEKRLRSIYMKTFGRTSAKCRKHFEKP